MKIEPSYGAVGELFNGVAYEIPKYQRSYAWDGESVEDFIKDLETCFFARKNGQEIQHFFGGILCIKYLVPNIINQHKYEIIDGQQRIATFTLLAYSLIRIYEKIKDGIKDAETTQEQEVVKERIEFLRKNFIEFRKESNREFKTIPVLKLSKADNSFYRDLVKGRETEAKRDSHTKLKEAYEQIYQAVEKLTKNSVGVDKIDDLEIIQTILRSDFTILSMTANNKEDAYRLFQVINDRGTSLTEGDLLKAKTLELVDELSNDQDNEELQERCEDIWNDILADSPSITTSYLKSVYVSYAGKRAKPNALFDDFLNHFFPEHTDLNKQCDSCTHSTPQTIYGKVQKIQTDIYKCRKLTHGQWLSEVRPPIQNWDVSRLDLLIRRLDHSLCIPLLLAASELDPNQKVFSEIVQIIEKVFFRYKLICNKHITPLTKIYYQEAMKIRESIQNSSSSSYSTQEFKRTLQKLIDEKATDQIFKNNLKTMEYSEKPSENRKLKYFLMTIEYYYTWYKRAENIPPKCYDKSKVYDFSGTSIEHIYPNNAKPNDRDDSLEVLKNSLGNLTILDPSENSHGSNNPFLEKREIYSKSYVQITKELSNKNIWTAQEVQDRHELLIDSALKVFYPK